MLDGPRDTVDAREVADAHLIFEDQKESGDDVAHQVLRAEADREAGDARAGQNRQHVDRQLAQEHQDCDEADRRRHQAGQNAAERRRAPLPFEIGFRVPAPQLELQMLDRQVRRAHDDEGADRDDDEVDAVRQQPVAEEPWIPSRLLDAEAAQRQRNRGERRDAVREDRQRTHQLIGACTNRRTVLGADDLQRVEEPVDERLGNPDGDGRGDERQHDDANRRVVRELHHSRLIFK